MLRAQTAPDLLQVYDLVIDRRFEYFMLFWIVMSCGQMMAERPSFSHTSLPYRVRTSCFTVYVYNLLCCSRIPFLVMACHFRFSPCMVCILLGGYAESGQLSSLADSLNEYISSPSSLHDRLI